MLAGGDSIGVVRDEGRRVPAAVELDGEVGDSGLGDLAAVVDQNDVIDGGMSTGPGGIGLATGRLVVEPTLVWVDGLKVHRQSDGPGGAHRSRAQLDADRAGTVQEQAYACCAGLAERCGDLGPSPLGVEGEAESSRQR
jgi:hypothetical protein